MKTNCTLTISAIVIGILAFMLGMIQHDKQEVRAEVRQLSAPLPAPIPKPPSCSCYGSSYSDKAEPRTVTAPEASTDKATETDDKPLSDAEKVARISKFEQTQQECDDLHALIEARRVERRQTVMPVIDKLCSNRKARTLRTLREAQILVSKAGLGQIFSEENGFLTKEKWFSWMTEAARDIIEDIRAGKIRKDLEVLSDIRTAVENYDDNHCHFIPRKLYKLIPREEWESWLEEANSNSVQDWCDKILKGEHSAKHAFCVIHWLRDDLYMNHEIGDEDEIWISLVQPGTVLLQITDEGGLAHR